MSQGDWAYLPASVTRADRTVDEVRTVLKTHQLRIEEAGQNFKVRCACDQACAMVDATATALRSGIEYGYRLGARDAITAIGGRSLSDAVKAMRAK